MDWVMAYPKVGSALAQAVPGVDKVGRWYGKRKGGGLAVRLSEEGEVLEVLDEKSIGRGGKSVSEVTERETESGRKNKFWVGSVNAPFAGTFLR